MTRNPYRARGVPYKPWRAFSYYEGGKVYLGRYWTRWAAWLSWLGLVEVEYAPDDRGSDQG